MDVVSPGRSRSGFILAALSVLAMIGIRWGLSPVLKESAPLILFMFPVVLSAWFGGFGPGLLATVLGGLAGIGIFYDPSKSAGQHSLLFQWTTRAVPFGMVGLFISFFAATIERARASATASGEESRRSEEFVRRLMASSADRIQVLDLNGRLLPGVVRETAVAPPPFAAEVWSSWPDGWDAAYHEAAAAAIVTARTGRAASFTAAAGGKWWDVVVTAVLDRDAYPERLLAVSRDATERQNAEAALRQSEAQLRQIADTMPQIVWAADAAGRIDYFNQRWYDYTGLPPVATTGGVETEHVIPADDRDCIRTAWAACVAAGTPYEMQHRIRRAADSALRWHLGRAVPIRDSSGNVIRWLGTSTDIHDARLLQEQNAELLQSERAARNHAEHQSRMREEFLATLSHELRTPLNAILGWVQVMQASGSERDDTAEGLGIIERNARAQARIIEDLLDMSRIISGKVRLDMQPIEPAGVIEASLQTVQPTAALKGVRLISVVAPNVGLVAGDPNRLQQVAWNLLTNAVKFTPAGGTITVTLDRPADHVRLTVADTGDGIDPDFLPHVFDRFRQADGSTTRRHNGLGLGLSIVKQLVELHGGTISAASDGVGHGASFTVTLPIATTPAIAGDQTSDDATPRPRGRLAGTRVLVVDDEPDARAFVRRLLEDNRAEVHTAASAEEALTALSTWPADVLVSDIGMPGQDGYDLIRQLRQRGPEAGSRTPAIALTAYARVEDRVRVVVAGFQAHLAKPVDVAELLTTIASLAESAEGRR